MNLVGYDLHGQDNDTHMFPPEAVTDRCDVCNYRLDFLTYNPNYALKKSKRDISATYDGFLIVSEAFRKFCVEQGYKDLVFGKFRQDKTHYNFTVKRIVKFDAVRRGTRFEKLCPGCGNYESIIGATPSHLLIEGPLEDGFYRSDLLFGSGDEKHPLIFVGIETRTKLEKAQLKGLEFAPAFGCSQSPHLD